MFKLRPLRSQATVNGVHVWGQREIGRFGILDLGSGRVDVRWERGACAAALLLQADILHSVLCSACSLRSKSPKKN